MNKVQKLENKIVNYAITIGGVHVEDNKDYRQLRKGVRLTHKLQGGKLSYYDWLLKEQLVWQGIIWKQQSQESGTMDKEVE